MPRALVCLDEIPAGDGSCANQAWIEIPTLEPLSLADAQTIGQSALLAWVTIAAVLLVRKAF